MLNQYLKVITLLALTFCNLNCANPSSRSTPPAMKQGEPMEAVKRQMGDLKSKISESDRLNRIFELYWQYTMINSPEYATQTGYPGQNDRWSDLSLKSIQRLKSEVPLWLQTLQDIDRTRLNSEEQLSYDVLSQQLDDIIHLNQFPNEFLQMSQMGGIHTDAPSLLLQAPQSSVEDYRDRIRRLEKLPELVAQTIVLMKQGMRHKVTFPQIVMRDVPRQVAKLYETTW